MSDFLDTDGVLDHLGAREREFAANAGRAVSASPDLFCESPV